MRELTINEMNQVSGGFLGQAAASCTVGAVTQSNGVLGGIMGCAGGTASGLAFTMMAFTGPVGAVAFFGLGVGIAFATYSGQRYFQDN